MTTPLRLIFMGTPDFAVPTLEALLEAGHEVVCVYSQPPRPAGRGQKERPSPVHAFAAERGIEVRTPKSLRNAEAQADFSALKADAAVVVAYGLILPKEILEAPKYGCFNGHASILPRWRGAAPIQRAIIAGDAETGVTIMQMDEGLDTGDMVLMETLPITAETTASSLHDALSALGGKLIVPALEGIISGTITPTPQPEEGVTYAKKLEKSEGLIDWSQDAEALERLVRGLTPWPGCAFVHEGQNIKVHAVQVVEPQSEAEPGTVLDNSLTVACGSKALKLLKVQRPGKGPMEAEAFLRGYPLPVGTKLG